jgi:hypothetical protein
LEATSPRLLLAVADCLSLLLQRLAHRRHLGDYTRDPTRGVALQEGPRDDAEWSNHRFPYGQEDYREGRRPRIRRWQEEDEWKKAAEHIAHREGARLLLGKVGDQLPQMERVWADRGYNVKIGEWMKERLGWTLEIVKPLRR